jgi:hypothetical protein
MDDATRETIEWLRKHANQLRELGHEGAIRAAERNELHVAWLESGGRDRPPEPMQPPAQFIESVNARYQLALIEASGRILSGYTDRPFGKLEARAQQFMTEMYNLYSPSEIDERVRDGKETSNAQ